MSAIIGRKFESSFKQWDESKVNGNWQPARKSLSRKAFRPLVTKR
jgi:hypothetical protein